MLGDEELAQLLANYSEGADILANGESILPRAVFDLTRDLLKINQQEGIALVNIIIECEYRMGLTVISRNIKGDSMKQSLKRRQIVSL